MFPGDLAVVEINIIARRAGTESEEWLKCRQLVLVLGDIDRYAWSTGERVGMKAILVNTTDSFGVFEVPSNALMTIEKFNDPSRLFRPFQYHDV